MPGFKDLEEVLDMPAATNMVYNIILNDIEGFTERLYDYVRLNPSILQGMFDSQKPRDTLVPLKPVAPTIEKDPVRMIRV